MTTSSPSCATRVSSKRRAGLAAEPDRQADIRGDLHMHRLRLTVVVDEEMAAARSRSLELLAHPRSFGITLRHHVTPMAARQIERVRAATRRSTGQLLAGSEFEVLRRLAIRR